MEELADDPWWTDVRVVTPKQVRRMEDIEFISELFIGIMAGPQNKKESLDEYYETYERVFSEKAKYAKQFRNTRALISDVFDPSAVQDWSGKSDFYSLFLSFAKHADDAWTSTQKRKVATVLTEFRRAVDEAKKKDVEDVRDKTVGKYVQAVTRAASDIDRRKVRITILDSLVESAL
jgi:hypothetical protein